MNQSNQTETRDKTIVNIDMLTHRFLDDFPRDAARTIEKLEPADAAELLISHNRNVGHRVWSQITTTAGSEILPRLPDDVAIEFLTAMDAGPCAQLLARLDNEGCEYYLSLLNHYLADELRELMSYPADSAGKLMESEVLAFEGATTAGEAMQQLVRHPVHTRRRIFVLDPEHKLQGSVDLEVLVAAAAEQTLSDLSVAIAHYVNALDTKEEVAEKLEKHAISILPVVDAHQRLLGVIRGVTALDTIKEDIVGDLQAMVGASRDEGALSSSLFAVRKRQPWLQVNLLTGFLAASVVGLFESTIAQFTALAVLMPVAAGQSGNTGAQALAVTMRGLTLREITTRHWLRVTIKEATAGLLNGLAIAVTCGIGVYVWSGSYGLALVIALAMIISMTIAGVAGAIVPIVLKKLGQDPAQSSSIILTTVTDIAGFMSFLGIASALSTLLV